MSVDIKDKLASKAARTNNGEVHHHSKDAGERTLSFPENSAAAILYGTHNVNLTRLESVFDIEIAVRGNHLLLIGQDKNCARAENILKILYERAERDRSIETGFIDSLIRHELSAPSAGVMGRGLAQAPLEFSKIETRRQAVYARTPTQDDYIRAMKRYNLVFGTGPAGTGKTFLAVAHAANLLDQNLVERIVLTRPAVEAGENLGFLPGDMREKIDPYLRPLFDALYAMLSRDKVEHGLLSGQIEIAPLAFMRGRTLSNAAILLDEAQNTTPMQMKMFLTRLGNNSHMIVNGDPSQIDLPSGNRSGLNDALERLTDIEGIKHIQFTPNDIVRHGLVAKIVAAYQNTDSRQKISKPKIEIVDTCNAYKQLPNLDYLVTSAAQAVCSHIEKLRIDKNRHAYEIAFLIAGDSKLQALNSQWREKNVPTNVLAFPASDGQSTPPSQQFDPQKCEEDVFLGDIAISLERIFAEAAEMNITRERHFTHIVIHAILHLLGYDHQNDEDAETMENLEQEILTRLAI